MTETVVLRPTDGDWAGRGEWKGVRLSDGRRSASAGCPGCGELASLRDHEIGPDGRVSPSLVCPYDDCDFHAYVRLEGWRASAEHTEQAP